MKVLIKKEIDYFYLKNVLVIFLNIILVLFIVPTSLFPSFSFQKDCGHVASGLDKLIPVMLTVLLGIQLTSMQFYREKMNRNIEVLLALGYKPVQIWICKMVSVWIMVYLFYLIGLLFSFTILPIISPNIMQGKQFPFYLNLFLFSPSLGLSILGLNSVIHLIFDDIRIINLSLTLGVFLFIFFLPQISKIIPLAQFMKHFSVVSVLASIFLIFISLTILKIIPEERCLR